MNKLVALEEKLIQFPQCQYIVAPTCHTGCQTYQEHADKHLVVIGSWST